MHVTERRLDAVETVVPLVIFAVEKLLFCDFSTNEGEKNFFSVFVYLEKDSESNKLFLLAGCVVFI